MAENPSLVKSSSSNPPAPSLLSHLSQLLYAKLTNDNLLLCRTHMIPYLKGQQLFHYVDDSVQPPPRFLQDNTTPKPEYLNWTQTDQLILSALISYLSDNLIAQVVGHTTARGVWAALERLFTSQSHAPRIEPLSPEELYGLLLTHENRLSHSTHLPTPRNFSTNFTSNSPTRGRGSNHSFPSRGGYRGRGRGRTSSAPPQKFSSF
ncbi:uncharacterized protein LOC122294677 [Carya illinoinensis]|uniref:uncharacterized protein LOC122294677 n=1 Tax=Carya illinoinensis TaxID=32201 RepID=UPI001C7224F0|nr:uncharacterized protein LOC122294677 [Carya illinoinensis]